MNHPQNTVQRARRAVSCSPFQVRLFAQMRFQSVSLAEIVGSAGVSERYTLRSLSEGTAERSLLWLMQVGLLRREVDGQGLTDSFRLTPLGRSLVEQWQQQGDRFRRVSWLDRLADTMQRLFRGGF